MEERKVFKFLSTFSKRQLNRFEDYVNSPYFNKSEELCFVYVITKKYVLSSNNKNYFDYFQKELTKDKKETTQKNLDKYLSRIYLLALNFVVQEKLKEKEFLKKSLLMEHLIDWDELGMFDKVYQKSKIALGKEKLSYTNLMNRYLLERQKADYLSVNATNREGKQNLQETSDSLDQFYLAQKYNLEILKLSMETVLKLEYNYYLIENINVLIKEDYPKNELLKLQYQIFNIISNDENLTQNRLSSICDNLLEIASLLEEHIAYNIGQFLRNCIRRVFNLKNEAFYKYCFQLNNKLLEKGLLFYQNNIFASTFKNAIDEALNINELDWCEQFLNNYSQKIIPYKIRDDIINYANARIKFFAGNFEEARNFVQTLKFKDIYYKFALRRLEIMVYYELEEFLYLESLINSFRVALTPGRLTQLKKEKKEVNNKFLYYINKLLKIYQIPKGEKIENLNQLLHEVNNDAIVDQLWYSKKIQEAIKNFTV